MPKAIRSSNGLIVDDLSSSLPEIPASPILPLALAESLMDLWRVHDQIDATILGLKPKHPDYFRGRDQMLAIEDRISAIEDLLLETPAQTPEDVLVQMIVLVPRIGEDFDLQSTERLMEGMLRVLLVRSDIDFSGLLKYYLPELRSTIQPAAVL